MLVSFFAKAQFGFNFNPIDSSYSNIGGWSGKPLYVQKDSTGSPDSYYFKFIEPNVQFKFLPSSHNDGNPSSILWTDANGYLKKSPYTATSLVGGTGIGITGSAPNFTITNTSTVSTPTITNSVSRTLNSAFTISTTNNVRVHYTVRVSYNITILLGSTGAISLQYSINGGSTYTTISTVSNNLNLGIALSGYNDFILSGEIPANALVKITSTTSNATNTYQIGQETTY